jgi:hypothetical protein
MKTRMWITGAVALGLAIGSWPAVAAKDAKADEVLAAARKAIGDKKLDALKTLSVESSLQRNVGSMQMSAEVEILLELPDKYIRSDQSSGPMSGGFANGFNGDKVIKPAGMSGMAGGAMIIRMGPGGPMPGGEKLTPEQQEQMDKQLLRNARVELSRLMLGWFASAHPSVKADYTYVGEAESPDGKAHVVEAKNADGFSTRLFIDQQTNLPLMVTYQAPQPRMITAGGPRPAGSAPPAGAQRRELTEEERKQAMDNAQKQLEELKKQPPAMVEHAIYFDDWRETGGVKFPHKMRRASAGTTSEEWTVNKVRVNPKIDPKKFEG